MDDSNRKTVGCVISIIHTLYIPIAYLVNGWVLTLLWKWFVAERFGLAALTIPSAIGLSIIVGYLTTRVDAMVPSKNEEDRMHLATSSLVIIVLCPFIALGVGWIVHLFL